MTLAETLAWMRANANALDTLAHKGDLLALKVIVAYRELHPHQLDVRLQNNYLAVCDEFVRREIQSRADREELQARYDYKLPPSSH